MSRFRHVDRCAPQNRSDPVSELIALSRAQKRRHLLLDCLLLALSVLIFLNFNGVTHLHAGILVIPLCALLAIKAYVEGLWSGALQKMAQLDDTRITGALLDALFLPEPAVSAAAKRALTRLLPRLQASDAGTITPSQRKSLYRQLQVHMVRTVEYHIGQEDAEFLLAALKAVEQIGDAQALPHVKNLADSSGTTVNVVRVREAAQQCLASLYARTEQHEHSASLLRASDGHAGQSDDLLRPAAAVSPSDPHHLLRADATEHDEG